MEDYSSRVVKSMSNSELEKIMDNLWSDKYLARAAMYELTNRRMAQLPESERTPAARKRILAEYLPF